MRTFQLHKLLTNSEWLLGTNIFAIFHCDAFLRRNHSSARREPIKFKMFLAFTDFCVWRDAFSDLQKKGGGGDNMTIWKIWLFQLIFSIIPFTSLKTPNRHKIRFAGLHANRLQQNSHETLITWYSVLLHTIREPFKNYLADFFR